MSLLYLNPSLINVEGSNIYIMIILLKKRKEMINGIEQNLVQLDGKI